METTWSITGIAARIAELDDALHALALQVGSQLDSLDPDLDCEQWQAVCADEDRLRAASEQMRLTRLELLYGPRPSANALLGYSATSDA